MKIGQKRIYFDYAALTPLDKKVAGVMRKALENSWHNPSSLYGEGEKAREILEKSRKEIADVLHVRGSEVFFTSGGTESANLAIQGVVADYAKRYQDKVPHIVTSSFEHSAVLETLKGLAKQEKVELSIINPNEQGIINPASVEKEIKENTVLVCVMHANNEIGTIQPVGRIGALIKEFRKKREFNKTDPLLPYPYFFVDACQSPLYEDVSLERLSADILILDGIKIYGPRGAGVLAVKHGVGILPIIFGGSQEKGLRPGTENVVSAVGLAEALKLAVKMRQKESKRLTGIRDYAIEKILKEIPASSLNGSKENRLPNNINICFVSKVPIDSEFLVIKLDHLGFAVSSASACLNLKDENSSYVIESLGKPECASSSLRFTLGRETKKSDLDALIKALKSILSK